jgi:hypothetical protein
MVDAGQDNGSWRQIVFNVDTGHLTLRGRGRVQAKARAVALLTVTVRRMTPWLRGTDNDCMTVFYWVMGVLVVGTFVPSVLYLVLYAVTGEDGCMRRARGLWNYTRLLTLFAGNILIWGHVIVGLWRIWFP